MYLSLLPLPLLLTKGKRTNKSQSIQVGKSIQIWEKHPSWEKEKCGKTKKDCCCICHQRSDLQIYLGVALLALLHYWPGMIYDLYENFPRFKENFPHFKEDFPRFKGVAAGTIALLAGDDL